MTQQNTAFQTANEISNKFKPGGTAMITFSIIAGFGFLTAILSTPSRKKVSN